MRLKEKLDKEVRQLHSDMDVKVADIKALSQQSQKAKEEQQRLEQQLKEHKVNRDTNFILGLLEFLQLVFFSFINVLCL